MRIEIKIIDFYYIDFLCLKYYISFKSYFVLLILFVYNFFQILKKLFFVNYTIFLSLLFVDTFNNNCYP